MGVLNENSIMGSAAAAGGEGYQIERSLKFYGAIPHLAKASNFQPTSPYTVSVWVKRASLDLGRTQFLWRINSADCLYFTTSSTLSWERRPTTLTTTGIYRDTANWYHIVCKSESGAMYLYVNGSLVSSNTSTTANPYTSGAMNIGGNAPTPASNTCLDGYLAEFHWVQGTALGPESFGEFDSKWGHWKPIEYEGGHGSEGFYIPFSGSSTKHSLTAVGSAVHSTAQQKIGASSIYIPGAAERVEASAPSIDFAFGTGDFTIEGWLYWTTVATDKTWIVNRESNSSNAWYIGMDTSYYIAMATGNAVILNSNTAMNAYHNQWVHIAFTRQSGTLRVYINGVQKNSAASTHNFSLTNKIKLGGGDTQGAGSMAGYQDEVRISKNCRYPDGTTFTPSTTAFAEDSDTILLVHSDTSNNSTTFVDSSGTTGDLGSDMSANSNNFNRPSSGSMDSTHIMHDTPTNNFAKFHKAHKDAQNNDNSYLDGDLQLGGGGGTSWRESFADFEVPKTGKWYMEFRHLGGYAHIGLMSSPYAVNTGDTIQTGHVWYDYDTQQTGGTIFYNNSNQASSVGAGSGEVYAISVNEGVVKMYKSNSVVHTYSQNLSNAGEHPVHPIVQTYGTAEWRVNFGQGDMDAMGAKAPDANGYGSFYYTPPADHLALCSKNLPEPTVKPAENFNTVLYAGNSSSGRAITGVGFQPDLTWLKCRSLGHSHVISDVVRGATKRLASDMTNTETTQTEYIQSFNADGFTVGNDGHVNGSQTYAAWNWKMNGSGSSNSNGSTTSTVSANTSAGQSIVTYSGSSGNDTVGHGLSQAPNLVIVKSRANADQWRVGSIQNIAGTTMDFTDYLKLNATTDLTDESTTWNDTAPTSTVFSVGSDSATNHPGYTYVAYCFHSVEGYSKIGSYYGNGSADGTFIYMGFKPAWIMLKSMDTSYSSWLVTDNKLNPTNDGAGTNLWAEDSSAENPNSYGYDFLSNGFKLRATSSNLNSTHSFIYIAFAEQPFKYSNAR